MRVGGNKKCREFFESSPEYSKNMSIQDKYSAHFATQYKDKVRRSGSERLSAY